MSEILRTIGTIYRSLAAISNKEFKDYQLNNGQYLYLTRIYENPGIINDTLATLVKQERTTVAKSVAKLEQLGFIRKEVDQENKKIRRLYVTDKAGAVYDFLRREEQHSEKHALSGLTEKEQAQFLGLLRRVEENLENEWQQVRTGKQRKY